MKILALAAAGLLLLGAAGPSVAFEHPTSAAQSLLRKLGRADPLLQKTSCNKNDDDKQARCMEACDETWIKATQAYHSDIEKARGEKKACETKCGC